MHAGIFSPAGKTRVPCVLLCVRFVNPWERTTTTTTTRPLRKIYVQTSNGWRRKRERNRERESRIGYTRHRRVYRIRSGNVLGKWLRILAIDIFLREQKGARWNIKRSARLIANGKPPTHPHPPPPPAFTTTLRFMEHSVHSIFSIVDRPYLSYLCFF